MNKPDTTTTSNAFDDLLDGDPSSPEAFRSVTDEAQANREAARESVKRVASHVRARGEQAARTAHEKAHDIGVSIRRHAPSVATRARPELAKPIRWRVVGPILAGSTLLSGAVLTVLLAWNAHRYATLDEQGVIATASPAAATTPSVSRPATVALPDAVSPTAVPAPAPAPSLSAVAAPVATATTTASEAAPAAPEAAPISPALPPAPNDPSIANCTAAIPLLNGLFASTAHARTPEEIAWAAFGYRCAQSGALTYGNAGYAPKESEKKEIVRAPEGKATASTPARPPVRSERAKPRSGRAPARAVAATQPVPPSVSVVPASPSGTCALRGSAVSAEGDAIANAPVQITGLDGSRFEQRISTDGVGQFTVNVPAGARMRVVLRARGYLDDVRETMNCTPVALTGKKSNPFSSLFDAARRADRSIQGATGHR